MNSEFFFVNETENLFPHFNYDADNIPLGNSINFCISASWAPKESKNIFFKKPFIYYLKLLIKNNTQFNLI